MGLKRKLWLIYVNTCIRCMRRKRLEQTDHLNCDTTPQKTGHIDLVTVAFNNEHLIKQQLLLLKKFIQDKPVHFTIADNSNIPGKRKIIKNICRELGAGYISMPQNMLQHYPGGSYAHGSSLNWIYTNYIKLRRPTFFGFLDHDLFPIKTISISQLIGGQDFYGAINQRPKGWYLWAGLSIFRFKAVENLPLNFIPYIEQGEYLDTGGANYPILYKKYDIDKLHHIERKNIPLGEGTDYHSDYIQYLNSEWLHIINGSNWKGCDPNSLSRKENFINDLLKD